MINNKMRFIKFELPKRLSKKVRDWAYNSDYKQADLLAWLADNLPPVPMVRPNSELINWLADPRNKSDIKKVLSEDDLRLWELIAGGFVRPSPDDILLIKKYTKISVK